MNIIYKKCTRAVHLVNNILFIIEGEKTEKNIIENMNRIFFASEKFNVKIICLSAKQNIFMLYKAIKDFSVDDMEVDLISLLKNNYNDLENYSRDDFSEIYLFFDFEFQQNNLSKDDENPNEILEQLLKLFDNETEYGKLYISYPMVEAIKDNRSDINIDEIINYKQICSQLSSRFNDIYGYDYVKWKNCINNFLNTLRQVYNLKINYEFYKKNINPLEIFDKEQMYISKYNKIYVLSAFPEFLLDYNKRNFWNSIIK